MTSSIHIVPFLFPSCSSSSSSTIASSNSCCSSYSTSSTESSCFSSSSSSTISSYSTSSSTTSPTTSSFTPVTMATSYARRPSVAIHIQGAPGDQRVLSRAIEIRHSFVDERELAFACVYRPLCFKSRMKRWLKAGWSGELNYKWFRNIASVFFLVNFIISSFRFTITQLPDYFSLRI